MLAEHDEIIANASSTIYQLSQDEMIRLQCEAREDYYRRQRSVQHQMDKKNEVIDSQRETIESQKKKIASQEKKIESQQAAITLLQNENISLRNEVNSLKEQIADILRKL